MIALLYTINSWGNYACSRFSDFRGSDIGCHPGLSPRLWERWEESFLAQDWPLRTTVQPSEMLSMAAPLPSAGQGWN